MAMREGAGIRERIDTFLGEERTLVPGLGACLGFQLNAAFQQSYEQLSIRDRLVNFLAICATTFALVFLLVPATYHRFTRRLEETEAFLHLAQRMVGLAFLFLALSLALSLYLQARRAFETQGVSLGVAVTLAALLAFFWWVMPFRRAKRDGLKQTGTA